MELISCSDYVTKKANHPRMEFVDKMDALEFCYEILEDIKNYAQFLKTPLTLGMFIPTDLEGNVLEEPIVGKQYYENVYDENSKARIQEIKEYEKAQERVIFEGFELIEVDLIGSGFYHIVKSQKKEGQVYASYHPKNRGEKLFWNYPKTGETIEDLTNLGIKIKPEQAKKIGI